MSTPPPGQWYQEATINGAKMPARRKADTNERRWRAFIKPLLPFNKGHGRMVIELGCNAGFYLRKMRSRGYKAIGIEKEMEFIRHAHYWESCDPKGVEIIEGDLNQYNMPVSQIVIMANVHYWLTPDELTALVGKLLTKVMYCIVVGRHRTLSIHKSPCDFGSLRETFGDWDIKKVITGRKHYSVLFRNPDVVEKKTSDLFPNQQLVKSKRFLPSYKGLVDMVIAGQKFNYRDTDYYNYLVWRRFKYPRILFGRHLSLIRTMKEGGMLNPLVLLGDKVIDGDHRLIVAKCLGMDKIICSTQMEGGIA